MQPRQNRCIRCRLPNYEGKMFAAALGGPKGKDARILRIFQRHAGSGDLPQFTSGSELLSKDVFGADGRDCLVAQIFQLLGRNSREHHRRQ